MPIRAYLDGHTFDAETIRQMGIAFEMGLVWLRAPRAATTPSVRPWLKASSHWRNSASAILSVSVRVQAVRSAIPWDSPPVEPE